MSFNRGIKRDSYGANRNFNNRNMGGGGGSGGGGGRMGNMGGGGMGGGGGGGGGGGMNPWEGGMMPGRGILPTPNNNLSLASPQAQLAIASNLLSNLLRTQQDNQPQKVPSLLSLGNNYSGPGPNFNNQQNFNQGRFNDRTGRQNIKPQRPQPYNNKMGNNRARDGIVGRRGPQQSRALQSGNQRQNGNQIQRNDKSSKPIAASKQNQTVKKEQPEKNSDKTNEKAEAPVALSEENEETEESKKREWKDEKNELSNEKNEESGKTEESSGDKDDGDKGTGKKSAARHAESRYAEVPISNMFCHVCNKHMWDGNSFENHLRGRAHQLMMDKLDESYKLKVELMRHELRVAEEQRELSFANSKRRGKKLSVDLNVREYCTMCDLNFYGTLSSHRKSEKHQQLKTFLHPRCFPCAKEFPSRIEYDEHCLTPTHMKNAVQNEEQRKIKKKEKLAKGESEIRSADDEEKDVGTDLIKGEKLDESTTADDDYVTEIPEGQIDAKLKIPSYKHCRTNQLSVGKSLVKEVTGYQCDKCRRFMLTEEDLVAHLRSITHYRNFIHEIKTLQAAAESAAKADQEVKKEGEDQDDTQENSESEPKRAKLDIEENAQEDNANLNASEVKDETEDDKYDPAEANGDTDEENAEEESQEVPNDNESAEISLNEHEDLEISNDNEPEEKVEIPEKTPQTPRSQAAGRGSYGPRARGNRARRSRR